MFSPKILIGGAVALFIGLAVWAGYAYVINLQETVSFQSKEITKLEISNETLLAERKQIEEDLTDNKKNQEILNTELRDARASKEKLIKLFSDHDFAKLVQKKPGLIQLRINKATKKVFKELEDISDE